MVEPNHLQFVPFSSALDTAFWYKLSDQKLKVWGLSEGPFTINGIYFNGEAKNQGDLVKEKGHSVVFRSSCGL